MSKTTIVRIFIFVFLGIFTLAAQAEIQCPVSSKILAAHYQISSNADISKSAELTLWRSGKAVAHQYHNTHITEIWQSLPSDRIKPFRMFDEHKRTIEYQPGEKVHGKSEKDWSFRYQLISDNLLKKMTTKSRSQHECGTEELMTWHRNGITLTVKWLPELKLVTQLTRTQNQYTEQWQLISLHQDESTIKAFFDERYNYYSTDFADIGDDHTDPFLTQMVTQGFIEHGAHGFYDADGNPMDKQHQGHAH